MSETPPVIKNRRTPLHQTRVFWIIVLLIIVVVKWSLPTTQHGNMVRNQAVPVLLATARTSNVPIYISALGTVTPTYTVTVRTQINGQLQQVLYREGQLVKVGDMLAQIDPRPYEAQLVQYEGQLVRDQALLSNARIDLKRYQTLWKQDSIAKQTYDTQVSLVKQYEGAVEVDNGLIQNTRLNLAYCKITSPINGRIGLRLVDPGNYVQTSDANGIAVLTMLDPITVIFTIPEDDIPKVAQKIYANTKLIANAFDRTQNQILAKGVVLTIDNQIDTTTGTVKLKALFQNSENHLFPSQFVNIQLLIDTLTNALVVPPAAIQYSPKGPFVYLLNDNQTVRVQPVQVGVTTGDRTVIKSGLKAGQSVVTEGADKLADGSAVLTADPDKSALAQKNTRHWYLF